MAISEAALYRKFETYGHKHFCADRTCRRVYQCLAVIYLHGCKNPRQNERCAPCRGGAPFTLESWEPQECCRNNVTQIVSRDELLSHRLAGTGPWFKCKTCRRCTGWPQGHNPHQEEE